MLKFSGLLIGMIAVSGALSYALTMPKVAQIIAAHNSDGEYNNYTRASSSSCEMASNSCPMSMVQSACANKMRYEEKQAAYEASVADLKLQHELFISLGLSDENDILFDEQIVLAAPEKPKPEVALSLEEVWPDSAMGY